MPTLREKTAALTFILVAASASSPVFACATCGCSLSTDAAMGYSAASGWRFNLQYDYINQNQLRLGSHSIAPNEVATVNDSGGDQEVEKDTINRYFTLGLYYSPNASWNLGLQIPYIDRRHTTYGSGTNPLTPDQVSGTTISGLGDVKFITSYQGFLPTHNLGVQLGVKLPTGDYGGPNADGTGVVGHEPKAFTSGPASQAASPDNLVDTSLQAGTGSTDVIIGAYYYQAVSQDFDAFINGQLQSAVKEKLDQTGANFRPGNLATLSFGLRDEANPDVVPQLQINLSHKSRDQGALADTTDSAGTTAYLSPGVTMSVIKNLQVYGFAQVPVYSHLDGYQLFPRWTATVGLSATL